MAKFENVSEQSVWDDILLRDSLNDTGSIPSPGYPYTSPDIICTQQKQVDPATFKDNYNQSPGKETIVNQNNFMYVRGKNLGSAPSGGTVYLYWCPSSLLMMPNQWTNNAMRANIGGQWQPYNTLPQVDGGDISVTQAPFCWTPEPPPSGQHYCTIGAVSTTAHPWSASSIPSFPSWESFMLWVRNNQNICWRNITLIQNPDQPEWDRVDLICNPNASAVPLLVKAQCSGVPIGTTVTLKNDLLGITNSEVIQSENATVYSKGSTCPKDYTGYVETIAQLAAGQTWPTGATIETILYYGADLNSIVARFAYNFGPDESHPSVLQAKTLVNTAVKGILVPVGNCITRMQPAS